MLNEGHQFCRQAIGGLLSTEGSKDISANFTAYFCNVHTNIHFRETLLDMNFFPSPSQQLESQKEALNLPPAKLCVCG